MASSGVQVSTTGIVIASTGTVVTATTNGSSCCCGVAYRQARFCDGNALADVWMTTTDAATLTGSFKIGSNCFYFNFADATSNSPGTIYALTDLTNTYADCAHCCDCCDKLTVTITAPFAVAERGVYDLHRDAGCDLASSDLSWTTTPAYDEDAATAGMFTLFWNHAAARWSYKLIGSDNLIHGSDIGDGTRDCPELDGSLPAGFTVVCAD